MQYGCPQIWKISLHFWRRWMQARYHLKVKSAFNWAFILGKHHSVSCTPSLWLQLYAHRQRWWQNGSHKGVWRFLRASVSCETGNYVWPWKSKFISLLAILCQTEKDHSGGCPVQDLKTFNECMNQKKPSFVEIQYCVLGCRGFKGYNRLCIFKKHYCNGAKHVHAEFHSNSLMQSISGLKSLWSTATHTTNLLLWWNNVFLSTCHQLSLTLCVSGKAESRKLLFQVLSQNLSCLCHMYMASTTAAWQYPQINSGKLATVQKGWWESPFSSIIFSNTNLAKRAFWALVKTWCLEQMTWSLDWLSQMVPSVRLLREVQDK